MFLVHTSRDHAPIFARAVIGACRLDGWASTVQPRLLHTLFNRLLGQDLDFETLSPLAPPTWRPRSAPRRNGTS